MNDTAVSQGPLVFETFKGIPLHELPYYDIAQIVRNELARPTPRSVEMGRALSELGRFGMKVIVDTLSNAKSSDES